MTRTTLFLSLLLLVGTHAVAQTKKLDWILHLKPKKVIQVSPQKSTTTVLLPSSFSQGSIARERDKLEGDIRRVTYCYTSYKWNKSFDQNSLNRERIEKLALQYPEVIENPYIEWQIIEQTGCKSPHEGRQFFHGFILEYQSTESAANRALEIANLTAFLEDPSQGYAFEQDPSTDALKIVVDVEESPDVNGAKDATKNSEANFKEGNFALYQYFKKNIPGGGKIALNQDDVWVTFDVQIEADGKVGKITYKEETKDYIKERIEKVVSEMPDWNPAFENGVPVASIVNLKLRMSFSPIVRGMYYRDGKKPAFSQQEVSNSRELLKPSDDQASERINKVENSGVYRAMDVVIPSENVAIIMDVTSSMSMHLAAMSWWVENSADSLNIVHYTFFNDGNNQPDRKKKVGQTGGIYHGVALRDLPATLLEAMRNGNGGDIVENDFEAVVAAQNEQHNANALLLIVDNFSDVRDEELIAMITKKTHVLIAGEVSVVRTCYLNLAKATGGDVYVNGQRVRLNHIKKGTQITIAQSTYLFDGDVFTLL